MLIRLHKEWRSRLIFLLFAAMLLSLLVSRAALSISLAAFLFFFFLQGSTRQQVKTFLTTPLLWSMSLLFLLPLISGLWSEDQNTWEQLVVIKLPLLLLPLAFAAPIQVSSKGWQCLAIIYIVIMTAGSIWSAWHYVADPATVEQGYLQAKTIITPLKNDHVRFSWLVSVAILAAGWLLLQKQERSKWTGILLAVIVTWLIIYLHILAARTGLLCFYIIFAGFIFSGVMQRRKGVFILLAAFIVLPLTAWYCLPTFKNKLRYFRYDMSYFSKLQYLPGGNDAMRMISLKAGWEVFTASPLTGTGYGDIKSATYKRYELDFTGMLETDKIYPSSQWIVYAAGCGIAGLLVMILAMVLPFYTRVKHTLPWRILLVIAAAALLFDIGLEVQFGVFAHAFVILWCWKWWQGQNLVTP